MSLNHLEIFSTNNVLGYNFDYVTDQGVMIIQC